MSPSREFHCGPYRVSEYWWAGEWAVYVNRLLSVEGDFAAVCARVNAVWAWEQDNPC